MSNHEVIGIVDVPHWSDIGGAKWASRPTRPGLYEVFVAGELAGIFEVCPKETMPKKVVKDESTDISRNDSKA